MVLRLYVFSVKLNETFEKHTNKGHNSSIEYRSDTDKRFKNEKPNSAGTLLLRPEKYSIAGGPPHPGVSVALV